MAISVDPKNYNTYHARSYYDMVTSSTEMAKSDLTQAITLLGEDIQANPQNAPLFLIRAEMMEQMGDSAGALNEYESYLKTWPLNVTILQNEAKIYCSQKQWQKAIDAYTTIIDNFPERTQILYDRGRTYLQSGNLQKALDDLNNVIRSYPKEYSCFYLRAIVKNQIGDQAGYKNDLKTTVALLKELSTKKELTQEEQNILSSIQAQLR